MKKYISYSLIPLIIVGAISIVYAVPAADCTTMPTMPGCTTTPPPAPPELPTPEITLEGLSEIGMYAGEEYDEPGYSATLNGSDFSSQVVVTGIPEGTILKDFTVTYTATGEGGKFDQKTRLVRVSKKDPFVAFEEINNMMLGDKPQDITTVVKTETDIEINAVDTDICDIDPKGGTYLIAKSVGTCAIEFTFLGNDFYNSYKETKKIEITAAVKKDIEVGIKLANMIIGDLPQSLRFDSNAHVKFNVESDDEEICTVSYDDGDDFGGYYVSPESTGVCTIDFYYNGDEKYNSYSKSFSFTISPSIEDKAPNGGDMNGDGVLDSKQRNVLTIENEGGDFHSVSTDDKNAAIFDLRVDNNAVTTGGGVVHINECRRVPEGRFDNLVYKCKTVEVEVPVETKIDSVIGFTINGLKNGSTQEITLNIQLSGVNPTIDPRKRVGNQLMPIEGAVIKYITLSGKPVAQVTFSVTDGGKYDEDGIENGQIIDPVVLVSPIVTPTTTSSGGGVVLPPLSVNSDATLFDNKPAVNITQSAGKVLGASTTRELSYGVRGDDVKELQQMLLDGGYLKLRTNKPTGWFGPLTSAALEKWQKENGLPVTGKFTDADKAKLNK